MSDYKDYVHQDSFISPTLLVFFDSLVIASMISLSKFDPIVQSTKDREQEKGVAEGEEKFDFPTLPAIIKKFTKHHSTGNLQNFRDSWNALMVSPQSQGIVQKPVERWTVIKAARHAPGRLPLKSESLDRDDSESEDAASHLSAFGRALMRDFQRQRGSSTEAAARAGTGDGTITDKVAK